MSELPAGFVLDAPAPLPEGFTLDPPHPSSGPTNSLLTDIPRRLGTAAVDAAQAYLSPIRGRGGIQVDPASPRGFRIEPPTTEEQRGKALAADRSAMFNLVGGTEYIPETEGGRIGQSALAGALMAGVSPGGGLKALVGGAGAGAGAEATSFLGRKFGLPDRVTNILALLGGVTGGMAATRLGQIPLGAKPTQYRDAPASTPPWVEPKFQDPVVVPGSVRPKTAELARMARDDYGIPVSGAQMSDSRFVRKLDNMLSQMPFGRSADFENAQREGANRAVSRTFGENAPLVSPEVLANARTRIGAVFDSAAQKTGIKFDADLGRDLSRIATEARNVMTPAELVPADRQIRNVLDRASVNGRIDGEQYQALTKHGGPLDSAISSGNPNLARVAIKVRGALDDALIRHSPAEDVAALKEARAQWKAMKTVEPATRRADTGAGGIQQSLGDVNPASLQTLVSNMYSNAATAKPGQIPLNDIAKIGQRFVKSLPDSGSPAGMSVLNAGGDSLFGTLKSATMRSAVDPLVGAILRSRMYADSQIAAGTNPASIVLKQPHYLAQMLISERLANENARRRLP